VISISYGSFWLAIQKNSYERSGLLEEIAEKEIPKIEDRIGLKPTKRILLGASMGGFNAAQLAIHYPELFDRAALLCPSIIDLSPHASMSETKEFKDRANGEHAGVKRRFLEFYKFVARPYFPHEEDWAEDNIFNLIKKQNDPLPAFFISSGHSDEYGIFYGSHNLVKIMKKQKRAIEWVPVDGKHCSFDIEATQKFLYN
jgi:enterochelin esterase-like enzyme